MSLLQKLQKSSVIKDAAVATESEILNREDLLQTDIPIINLAFSGRLDGGVQAGFHQIAGPSATFKSNICMVPVKAFQEKYDDGIVVFYDNEFGTKKDYFDEQGIDMGRVLHKPFDTLEELKFDLVKLLDEIDITDNVFIFIDSLGNAASKKETDDALDEKSTADMTRAKQGKSVSRMVTPKLTRKNVVMLAINHTYDTMEMFSKTVVSGGTGWRYAADNIFTMGKRQVKEGSELRGFDFILNAYKSRFIKEKTALPLRVTFDGGIDRYSGLLDIAVAANFITRPNNRTYLRPTIDTDEEIKWTKKSLNTPEFWEPLLESQDFLDAVAEMFKLSSPTKFEADEHGNIIIDDMSVDPETGEVLDE